MRHPPKIRAAAVQFAVGQNVADNLNTCLRMIDQAALQHPDLVVLPEFVNHIAWYSDQEHCFDVAVELDGKFVRAIAKKARQHHCLIKFNVTLRREYPIVTGTNILINTNGEVIGVNDKQILMGNENNFLSKAETLAPIIPTAIGSVGMYACMDGVIPEVARALAVRSPRILLNSLNSFAFDEASLHIPVRAAENKVFVVAANKVGSLVPPEMLDAVAARLKISPSFLQGAGESQIVAPDGTVLAKGPRLGEAVVFAEFDPTEADHKLRPDGTHILAARRPAIYQPIGAAPRAPAFSGMVDSMRAAVYQPAVGGPQAVSEVHATIQHAADLQVDLLVLPELFYLSEDALDDLQTAQKLSREIIAQLQTGLQHTDTDLALAFSVIQTYANGLAHTGILLDRTGLRLTQPQLHPCGRHPWATHLADTLQTLDMPWGRFAMIVGGDTVFPEAFRLAVLQDVAVVASPTHILEKWETALGFPERAAENRMNVVAASFPTPAGASGLFAITEDFTLWTEWKNRPFDGKINFPQITLAAPEPGLTTATLYPRASTNRMVSHRTDLVNGRPWHLAAPISQTHLFTSTP